MSVVNVSSTFHSRQETPPNFFVHDVCEKIEKTSAAKTKAKNKTLAHKMKIKTDTDQSCYKTKVLDHMSVSDRS